MRRLRYWHVPLIGATVNLLFAVGAASIGRWVDVATHLFLGSMLTLFAWSLRKGEQQLAEMRRHTAALKKHVMPREAARELARGMLEEDIEQMRRAIVRALTLLLTEGEIEDLVARLPRMAMANRFSRVRSTEEPN